jgi:hypothetical protein
MGKACRFQQGLGEPGIHVFEQGMIYGRRLEGRQASLIVGGEP